MCCKYVVKDYGIKTVSLDHWQVLGDGLGLTVSEVLEAESKKKGGEREREIAFIWAGGL